jgi:NAD-dependent dihydropyrimidine dehydrogenase PreA subunit
MSFIVTENMKGQIQLVIDPDECIDCTLSQQWPAFY